MIQFAYVMIGASGNHGVEMDSKGDASPRSFPQLYSATFVHHLEGNPESVSSDDQFDATLRLREGTGGEFGNIIVTNVPNVGVLQNECGSETRTHTLPSSGAPDYLWFSSQNIIYGATGITAFENEGSCSSGSRLTTARIIDPRLTTVPGTADEDTEFIDPRPLSNSPVYSSFDATPSDSFYTTTNYMGAFDTDLWISDWSYLAENSRIPSSESGDASTFCGDITSDTTWSSDITLSCQVFVSDATLTINAGVTIYAFLDDGDGKSPALIVLPGARLNARGTSAAPITFTTGTTLSSPSDRGLWGGLIIMGNAPVYQGTQEVEGITGQTYGGNDATESSGTLEYVRVWHGGSVIGENNEINGITLAGVGSGTTVRFCEVAFNLDDGFEMFGGTVNLKYISVLFVGDDAIDTDEGYQGKIQFAFVMIGTDGHHGTEMDSKGDASPRSFPQLYSATFVGHLSGTPSSVSSDDQIEAMMRLREGTGGEFGNLILTNVNVDAVGVYQDSCGSEIRTQELPSSGKPDYMWFSSNNIVSGPGASFELRPGCDGITTVIGSDPALRLMPTDADYDSTSIDPSVLEFLDAEKTIPGPAYSFVDDVPDDNFFDSVPYKGAFSSDQSTWLVGWSWLADNDVLVETSTPGASSSSKKKSSGIAEPIFWTIIAILIVVVIAACIMGYICMGYKNKYEQLIDQGDILNPTNPAALHLHSVGENGDTENIELTVKDTEV